MSRTAVAGDAGIYAVIAALIRLRSAGPRDTYGRMDLHEKVAIVTGAARGVGAAIARRMATAGARVILADILDAEGDEVAREMGEPAGFAHLDVTDESQWKILVEGVVREHGRLDILVNNAAVLDIGRISSTSAATFRRVLDVNTTGPFLGTQAAYGPMAAQGKGAVINIGSIDGIFGTNGLSAYVTSKFGLRGLTKAAALEFGRDGIRVNYIASGGGNPQMYEPWIQEILPFLEDTVAFQNDRAIPGGAPPEAIAEAVVFLASDAAAHITGAELPVDNGATAGHFIAGFNRL